MIFYVIRNPFKAPQAFWKPTGTPLRGLSLVLVLRVMWWDWNILGHIFRPNQDVWTEKKISNFYQKCPKIEFSSSDIEDFGHFWQFLGVLGRRTRVTDLRWKFSCFVSIKGLLRYNIVPYGTLTIIGFPETTLLVVENRLRKVWGRFLTLRG